MEEAEQTLLNELWQEHLAAPFPKNFAGKDVSGIDFVSLDSTIDGCVSSFLERGKLDVRRTAALGLSYRDAAYILPVLNEEGSAYFWRLERLAELVLKELASQKQ